MFLLPIRIYYEDTDAAGVVYYANYLKFMERARTEWLRSEGYEQDQLARVHNVVFMVRSISLEYNKPARFNDLIQVGLEILDLKRVSIIFKQRIFAYKSEAEEETLVVGKVKVACVDATGFYPKAIPETLRKDLVRAG